VLEQIGDIVKSEISKHRSSIRNDLAKADASGVFSPDSNELLSSMASMNIKGEVSASSIDNFSALISTIKWLNG
jgi:hypothetical protein